MVGVLVKEYYADSAVEDIAGYTYEFYASWPVHDKPHAASLGSPIGMWPGSQTEHAQFSRMGSIRKALTGFFSDALSTRGGVA